MSELAVRGQTVALEQKIQYAKFLAASGLLPKDYRQQPANIMFAAEYGELLGLHPMAAITGINIIDGKPSISAGLISALVRRAGHKLRVTGNSVEANCQIIRADDPGFVYSSTWTMERAKTAGLLSKTNWQRYPDAMLKARATSEAARDACQEVLLGIAYTPDELGADDDGGEVIDDGWPTLPGGMIDQAQMSEHSKDQAGLMTRHDRVEHDELRRGADERNPDAITHAGPDPVPDDPWHMPEPGPKSPPAPKTWQENLAKLVAKFPLGPDEDVTTILTWVCGRAVNLEQPVFTRSEVKLVGDIFQDHLKTAEGDYEAAASNLWDQYRRAQESDMDT